VCGCQREWGNGTAGLAALGSIWPIFDLLSSEMYPYKYHRLPPVSHHLRSTEYYYVRMYVHGTSTEYA
jgi:hypothetical protein